MNSIVQEKLDQAVGILRARGIDAWITFTRESDMVSEPCLGLVAGVEVTWHSAFIISATGRRIAIAGRYDAGNIRALGAYDEVIAYDQSIREPLRDAIVRLDPAAIGVNTSLSDPSADGLTHGMHETLRDILGGTPYADRLVSAEKVIASLRGQKSESEVARIRAAIRTTERMYRQLGEELRPGMTEAAIAGRMHARVWELGLGTAWDEAYCPVVNAGPESNVGHANPGALKLKRGHLLHLDFGIRQDEYCSDLQRMWYVPERGDNGKAPDDVRRAWDACWGALDAGAAVLKPGVMGWQVDEAARNFLVRAGYPEYQHALGHGLGRSVHDGATLLGPRWERYGETPMGMVEAGNVFTLELGTAVPGRGFIGIEENVLVTPTGIEWLSKPQRKLWTVE